MKSLLKLANGTNNSPGSNSVGSSSPEPDVRNDVSKAGRSGSFNSLILPMKYDCPKMKKSKKVCK